MVTKLERKIDRLFFLIFLLLTLVSCQSLKEKKETKQTQKPQLEVSWITPTVGGTFKVHRKMTRMSPLITEDVIYQANNIGSLVAIKRKTGRILWTRSFKGGVEAGASLFKDLLFVAANDGTVSALKSSSGDLVWSFSSSSENVSVPVLDPSTGLLYFQNSQNLLFCLEADTGRQVWVFSRPDSSPMTIRGSSSPIVREGLVYAGFSEGTIAAVRASNGQLVWEQNLNRNKKFRDIDAQAVLSGQNLYIAGYDDRLYNLRADNGQIVWSTPAGSYSAVSLQGDFLYVSTSFSEVLKLRQDSGEVVWKYGPTKGLATQVSFLDRWVVFGESQGSLVILDSQTGKQESRFDTGRGIFAKPTVDSLKNEIFTTSNEAYVYKLKLKTQSGAFSWIN